MEPWKLHFVDYNKCESKPWVKISHTWRFSRIFSECLKWNSASLSSVNVFVSVFQKTNVNMKTQHHDDINQRSPFNNMLTTVEHTHTQACVHVQHQATVLVFTSTQICWVKNMFWWKFACTNSVCKKHIYIYSSLHIFLLTANKLKKLKSEIKMVKK